MNIVTKIFIVLTLVCSIVLSVFVVVTLPAAQQYKVALDKALAGERTASMAYQAMVAKEADARAMLNQTLADKANQVANLNKQYDTLNNNYTILGAQKAQVDAEKVRVDNLNKQLTANNGLQATLLAQYKAENDKIRPDINDLSKQNVELRAAVDTKTIQLEQMQRALDRLKEQLSQANKPAAAVEGTVGGVATLSTGIATAVPTNGKVTGVTVGNGGVTYLQLSLGGRDNIIEGTRFIISRGDKYVGDAIVTKVAPDQSVAKVREGNPLQVQVNDLITSGQQ